jgi:hypothetical protein
MTAADATTVELFQQDWKLYRKMVDNNFLFHREAYAALHEVLVNDAARPFRFLDIACGDASASVGALRGTDIAHYHGIDFSGAALGPAEAILDGLFGRRMERHDGPCSCGGLSRNRCNLACAGPRSGLCQCARGFCSADRLVSAIWLFKMMEF